MNFTLFETSSLLKVATVASMALMACTDNSSSVTYVMYDEYGSDLSSSAKTEASSSSAKVSSSSSRKSESSSSAASSSAKASSSSSEKAFATSSSGKAPESSASSSSAEQSASSSSTTISSSSVATAESSSAVSSSSAGKSFFSENWRQSCLDKINEYRATEGLDPLTLAPEEKQTCTDKEAADDLASNKAHGHFGDCGEGAQNSGPNFNTSWRKTAIEVSDAYLKMMWEDEKALVTSGERDPNKDEDYPYIGHYLNMKGNYKTVACGIALSEDGKKGWFNVNFFRR